MDKLLERPKVNHREMRKHALFLPVTPREAEHSSLPCWLDALQVYSPLSSFEELRISREEAEKRLIILYLSPSLMGWPSLNHLKFTFGASSVSHSNLAELPMLISRGTILCLNTGFTVFWGEKWKRNDKVSKAVWMERRLTIFLKTEVALEWRVTQRNESSDDCGGGKLCQG